MSGYFPKSKSFRGRVILEIDLSNYATNPDSKNAGGVHTSKFEDDKFDIDKIEIVTTGLYNMKSKIDQLDVDKLVPGSNDLSKLNNLVKN